MGNNWDNNVCLLEFHFWQWQTGLFQINIPTKIKKKKSEQFLFTEQKRHQWIFGVSSWTEEKWLLFPSSPLSSAIRKGWKTTSVPSPPSLYESLTLTTALITENTPFPNGTEGEMYVQFVSRCQCCSHFLFSFKRTLFCLKPVYLYPESNS